MQSFSTVIGVGPGAGADPSNDGIGLSVTQDGDVNVDIDFSGSGDDGHSPARDVSKGVTIATITYNTTASTSFVNGCEESKEAVRGAPAVGLMAGSRADPGMEYHRFLNGTIHELRVYSPPLTDEQRVAVEKEIASTWGVKMLTSCVMPRRNHSCDDLRAAHGLLPAQLAKLTAFVKATGGTNGSGTVTSTTGADLTNTLAHEMALLALAYDAGFQARCTGLNQNNQTRSTINTNANTNTDGTGVKYGSSRVASSGPVIPALRSFAAEEASLLQMLGAAKSMDTGVQNHATNTLARLAAEDPLAKALLAAWNASY
jgi:hypothetical protein